jgi:hypothetical protein
MKSRVCLGKYRVFSYIIGLQLFEKNIAQKLRYGSQLSYLAIMLKDLCHGIVNVFGP